MDGYKPKPEIIKRDEDQILDSLATLETELTNSKEETIKRNNEKEERLRDVISDIIAMFKISKKSVEKVIDLREKK